MSTTTSAFSNFKEPFIRYFDELPNEIPEAIGSSIVGSFILGSLFSWSISYGGQCALLGATLTLVNAAVKPFFDRHFPEGHHGKRLIAENLTVVVLVAATVTGVALLTGKTLLSIAIKLSFMLVPSLLIRLWRGFILEKGVMRFQTELNEYAPRPDSMVKARYWITC